MVLKRISGIAPTTGNGMQTVINAKFPANFQRILFEVVPYDPSTSDHIPGSEAGAPGGENLGRSSAPPASSAPTQPPRQT
jgi:hypothetical protein